VHQQLLLVLAVLAVGIFHTLVPDHWLPITVLARQAKWKRLQTAGAAALAGVGHTVSTLAIGALIWAAGAVFALRFGHMVSIASSVALVIFGAWFAFTALRELRHGGEAGLKSGIPHPLLHHDVVDTEAAAKLTGHLSASSRARLTLLLILGSSPMIEGLPAFLAAGRFGPGLLAIMSIVFGLSTIATYVFMCDQSTRLLQRFSFGPLERYGEVISGCVILAVGIASFFWL